MDKILKSGKEKERRVRTRRLIETGEVLEKIIPESKLMSKELLEDFLKEVINFERYIMGLGSVVSHNFAERNSSLEVTVEISDNDVEKLSLLSARNETKADELMAIAK